MLIRKSSTPLDPTQIRVDRPIRSLVVTDNAHVRIDGNLFMARANITGFNDPQNLSSHSAYNDRQKIFFTAPRDFDILHIIVGGAVDIDLCDSRALGQCFIHYTATRATLSRLYTTSNTDITNVGTAEILVTEIPKEKATAAPASPSSPSVSLSPPASPAVEVAKQQTFMPPPQTAEAIAEQERRFSGRTSVYREQFEQTARRLPYQSGYGQRGPRRVDHREQVRQQPYINNNDTPRDDWRNGMHIRKLARSPTGDRDSPPYNHSSTMWKQRQYQHQRQPSVKWNDQEDQQPHIRRVRP